MSNDSDNSRGRPSPDELLTIVQRESRKAGRGHLKVFLGMVAGVGKTYAMLQRAHQLKGQGVDVVIGWIDTHGRKDTEALLAGLEIVPPLSVVHRGVAINEMNLDAVLARRAKVVIVDELAHTNAPGGRHVKRYLDVLEILNAGIDVFTAVNIQHLESRVDTVKQITGVSVQETVPDSVLDEADEVSLIDLPAEDLLRRMKEGRIYGAERAEAAGRNFFSVGNLTALRELALRAASERVDRDLREFKTRHGIDAAWKSSSRLMVAVFGSPYSDSLIRWTRQLSETMHGTWLGVHVDTSHAQSDVEQRLLEANISLVRQLGGEVISIQDQNLVDGILRVARQQNVTQIVVGKTQRGFFSNLFSGGSIVSRLLAKSGSIDVYAVSAGHVPAVDYRKLRRARREDLFPWGEIGWAFVTVVAVTFLGQGLAPYIGYESVGTLFLIAVTLSGLFLSRTTVVGLAVSFSLLHNFFFIPPLHTFAIDKPHDVLMFAMYFVAASVVGSLTTRLKRQNRLIQGREDKAVQLFNLAQAVAAARSLDKVVAVGADAIRTIFKAKTAVIFFSENGEPEVHRASTYNPDAKELAVAEWVRSNSAVAGRFTDTLPAAAGIYFPLATKGRTIGALGIKRLPHDRLDFERKNFAYALVGQIASGIEREQLHEAGKRLEVLEQAEKLHRSLFDSVSHELKTPLTTIQGAASILLGKATADAEGKVVRSLLGQMEHESQRLLEVVDNMLDMTRVESGAIKPNLQLVDVADVLGPALRKVEGAARFETRVETALPPLRCDPILTVQALVNILKNAVAYGGSGIEVAVGRGPGQTIEFRVRDHGPGLKNPEMVFDRFYRGTPERSGGLGLGLSIARGFIEVQGGLLIAENAADGGAQFSLRLTAES